MEWESTDFGIVNELCDSLMPFVELWTVVNDFHKGYSQWMHGCLFEFNLEHLQDSLPRWIHTMACMEEKLTEGPNRMAQEVHRKILEFSEYVPLISGIRTPGDVNL